MKLYVYFSTRCRHIRVPFIASTGIGWKKKISHSGPVDKTPITSRLEGCAGARDCQNTVKKRYKNLTHVVQEIASHFIDRIIIHYTGSSSSDS